MPGSEGVGDTQLRHLHSLFIRIHLAFICARQMVNGQRLTVIADMDRLIHNIHVYVCIVCNCVCE